MDDESDGESERRDRQFTFIVVVVDQLLGRDHVEELQHPAVFHAVGGCTCKHGHGVHAHLQARSLRESDTRVSNFDSIAREVHAVQPFDCDTGHCGISVFAECNALQRVRKCACTKRIDLPLTLVRHYRARA